MGTRRYVYNRTLNDIKTNGSKIDFRTLRNKFVTKKNNPLIADWELKTPKDIRAGSIRDLCKNYKTAFSHLKSGLITKFKMDYCRKKSNPSIEIPKNSIKIKNNKMFIFSTFLKTGIKISNKQRKKNIKIEYYCRLQCKNNNWYMCIPVNKKSIKENKNNSVCSLDPGVRSFQTIYSEKEVVQIKPNNNILRLLRDKIDKFNSLRSKKIIRMNHVKRRINKLYSRINNLIDDLHYKTIKYLTNNFKYIILPKFESQKLSGKIYDKRTNRNLIGLKHYLFQCRLQDKCSLNKIKLDICTEEYTSKTCGKCGHCNNIKSKDVLKCNNCSLIIDRDVNGSRNIFIKRIKELKL